MKKLVVLLACLHAGNAVAHHAFAADYEAGNEGVIEGIIYAADIDAASMMIRGTARSMGIIVED